VQPVTAILSIVGVADEPPTPGSLSPCPIALLAATHVGFDATGSSGRNLNCRIDFGDGSTVSTAPTATHIYKVWPTAKPSLIVSDREGHVGSVTKSVCIISIAGGGMSWSAGEGTTSLILPNYDADDASILSGWYRRQNHPVPPYDADAFEYRRFAGKISPDHSIALKIDDGSVLTGPVTVEPGEYCCLLDVYFDLTAQGGPDDGRTMRYLLQNSY
jgi:hypothetical protein